MKVILHTSLPVEEDAALGDDVEFVDEQKVVGMDVLVQEGEEEGGVDEEGDHICEEVVAKAPTR